MIGFRLDARSNVVPYLQLVEQVRQALRIGLLETGDQRLKLSINGRGNSIFPYGDIHTVLLETGDQLPTVRDVARELAINPNTVLKAYRELELEGLVDGRPGQGTFVLRSLAGPSLANQAGLRRELLGWLRRARRAGLDGDDIVALIQTTVRDLADEGVA